MARMHVKVGESMLVGSWKSTMRPENWYGRFFPPLRGELTVKVRITTEELLFMKVEWSATECSHYVA